jgi:hypothetical protein
VSGVADLMYLQASKGQLGVTRIFAVDNKSKPPRTQMNDANFEFYIPAGAEIDGASAQTAGGQGVNISPAPQADKGRYAFVFPLRPGQTEFQVSHGRSASDLPVAAFCRDHAALHRIHSRAVWHI